MKKVLLISFEYPTSKIYCGGVGQIVKQCRKALLDLGYEVYVLISSKFQKKHPIKVLFPDGSLIRYRSFWSFQKKHDLGKFDFIVQHFVNWTRDLKKLKNSKGKRPKIIYHFHSILRREKDSGFKTFNRFLLNQEKMIELADKIICPSKYEYDNFIRYFPYFSEKVKLIENTIETFPHEKNEIQNIKERHGIKEDDIVSIYVGRLETIKGAHIIIRYLPEILNKYDNHKIFIVGKVLERNLYRKLVYIQKRYPDRLFYMKYLEKNRLYQYYYLSHIYINTSSSESFSLSTHESAFCNNALLLNRLPVLDKFRDAAIFFSNHDSKEDGFISTYKRLVRSKQLRNKLSKRAFRFAKEVSSNDRLKKRLSELFETV